MGPEAKIKRQICEWLERQPHCYFWVQSAGKIPGRRSRSRFQINGVADILGIWKGRPLAIEVKAENGQLSKEQQRFLAHYVDHGGIAVIAKSIEDVKHATEYFDRMFEKEKPTTSPETLIGPRPLVTTNGDH